MKQATLGMKNQRMKYIEAIWNNRLFIPRAYEITPEMGSSGTNRDFPSNGSSYFQRLQSFEAWDWRLSNSHRFAPPGQREKEKIMAVNLA